MYCEESKVQGVFIITYCHVNIEQLWYVTQSIKMDLNWVRSSKLTFCYSLHECYFFWYKISLHWILHSQEMVISLMMVDVILLWFWHVRKNLNHYSQLKLVHSRELSTRRLCVFFKLEMLLILICDVTWPGGGTSSLSVHLVT